MQEYANNIVQSVGILVAAISTLLTVLAPLVGLVTSALVSSGIIAADSKIAVFVAKLFPLSIHATSAVKPGKTPSVPPSAIALLFVGLLGVVTQSCSLEAARQARINSQLKAGMYGAPVTARPAAECKALDDIHVYTAYGAEVSLGVGVGAGALAAANTSQDIENAAVATGIGAVAVAGTLAYWSQKSGAQWTERCGQ